MDAAALNSPSDAGVCVVEPGLFRHSLLFLADPPDVPLTLSMVHALRVFADACILHEKVICPNPYPPQIRHASDLNDHDVLELWLQKRLRWNFVQTDLRVGDYGNTAWYQEVTEEHTGSTEQPKADENPITAATRTNPDKMLINAPDFLNYLDHIAAIGEAFQATVVFDEVGLASYYHSYKQLYMAPQVRLLKRYEEQLRKRISDLEKSVPGRSCPLYRIAPMFLYKAVADAAQGQRDRVLHAIADMHHRFARPYREFIAYALTTKDRMKTDRLLREAKRLLFQHAATDDRIPRAHGRLEQSLIYLLKIGGTLPELLTNLGRLMKGGIDVVEEDQFAPSTLTDYDYARMHRGLNFLNRFDPQMPTVRDFYQVLKNVFGKLAFTQEELNQYLAKY